MRDVFYTLLVVWIIWKIMNSVNNIKAKTVNRSSRDRREGETTVDYVPPVNKSKYDGAGEYVDYEEIKD